MTLRTCVAPSGRFVYGLHRPRYTVANLREGDPVAPLGLLEDSSPVDNRANFPPGDVREEQADWIFEIPNPFPFRGTTYIDKTWADAKAADPGAIGLPPAPEVSFREAIARLTGKPAASPELEQALAAMPESVLLALAATSTDPADLAAIARLCCDFVTGPDGRPEGLRYRQAHGRPRAVIRRHALFEAVVNNPRLPDEHKKVMVLRPGAQGGSEIVGEWRGAAHIYEYLRRNSYIPWGHYAANFADDSIRYRAGGLTAADMGGLRHLYYQRTYVRLAAALGLAVPARRQLEPAALEELRLRIAAALAAGTGPLPFTATLWGWNYGFDFAPSGYRLHASHQQIHQQFALLPPEMEGWHAHGEPAGPLPSYGCGDLVADFIDQYRRETGVSFFEAYIEAIRANRRLDGWKGESSLVVWEDGEVMLFVPKAQTSQWELQLMTVKPVGNILEAEAACRQALDRAMLLAMRTLAAMGARMVTTIEYPKRFGAGENGQRLLYAFLPRLPESPGAFSEAQLRFINGHYPEDFAAACRARLPEAMAEA